MSPHLAYCGLICTCLRKDEKDLAGILAASGIELISADSMAEGIRIICPDCTLLVLLDLDSDPNWRAAIRTFQLHAPEAAIIVYSRMADPNLWLDALEAGAFDLVSKPFSQLEVRWVLESALKSRTPHHVSSRLAAIA